MYNLACYVKLLVLRCIAKIYTYALENYYIISNKSKREYFTTIIERGKKKKGREKIIIFNCKELMKVSSSASIVYHKHQVNILPFLCILLI